jgi:hypothetical protein
LVPGHTAAATGHLPSSKQRLRRSTAGAGAERVLRLVEQLESFFAKKL